MKPPKKRVKTAQKSRDLGPNTIPLSFEKAIEGLLSVRPKKKPAKKKKKPSK
jgi:hypothetical protein